jgi:hypothetical protein
VVNKLVKYLSTLFLGQEESSAFSEVQRAREAEIMGLTGTVLGGQPSIQLMYLSYRRLIELYNGTAIGGDERFDP